MYFLSRLAFYAFNSDTLQIETWASFVKVLRGGLLFDTATVAYTNLLFALVTLFPLPYKFIHRQQKLAKWVYFLLNIPCLVINLADIIYTQFTGRRTSLTVFSEFKNENPLSFLHFFVDYYPITLIGLGLIALWLYLYQRVEQIGKSNFSTKPKASLPYYLSRVFSLLLIGYLSFGAMRGSFADVRPIRPSLALRYTTNTPRQALMVLNTPFVMIRLGNSDKLTHYHFMPKEEANQIFNPLRIKPERSPLFGKFRGRNIVLIIWESCAREWVGKLNQDVAGYKGYTPYLDKLLDKSYYFERAFANGAVSIDLLPALIASLPKTNTSYVSSSYATNKLNSLVEVLNSRGYHTTFSHNAPTGSMGFDAMTNNLKYQQYLGMEDFNNDDEYDGSWGIWDEPFLQYIIAELNKQKEPFFLTEFTTSSHTPFVVPKQYEKRFPPTPENGFHQVVAYSDYAIGRFFEEAQKQAWYDNTLFVILGDHSAPPSLDKYKNTIGAFSIPIIFFDPRGELRGVDKETVVQQADLMPTLMDLLGIEEPMISFGNNIFNPNEKHFAYNSMGDSFQIVQGDYALIFDGERVLSLYNYKDDPKLKHNLKGKGLKEEQAMKKIMQAFLQELSERLRNDKLSL